MALRLGVALVVILTAPRVHAQPLNEPVPGASNFIVFLRVAPIGAEQVDLIRTDDGWIIQSGGQLSAPISREARVFTVEYDRKWQPRQLLMNGIRNGEAFLIESVLNERVAVNRVQENGQESTSTHSVAEATVVLSDFFFGAYEALAVRLQRLGPGDTLPIYVAPTGSIHLTINNVLSQALETSNRRLQATIYRVTFHYRNQPVDAEVWVDDRHRLLRVTLPIADLDIVRQDISLVSTRLAGVNIPGDKEVFVPASGFGLSATVTTPIGQAMPRDGWPAVVLVPGTKSTDRDELMSGVPIFGQLAEAVVEAGYLVVRYDRRGFGRSGGRPESSTIADYAEDVRAIVDYLEDHDGVDDNRIAIVSHGEGGWIGLRAAAREKKIAAAVLLAVPAITGSDLVLEQQRAELDRLQLSAKEREDRIALQRRIHDAVVEDASWDDIPQQFRRQADTPWFKSFLKYEPADVIRRTGQPLLIMHGMQDDTIHPYHADHLAELARQRGRREATVDMVLLPDVNHALLTVAQANPEEYTNVENMSVAPEVMTAIIGWLDRVVVPD